MTVLIAANLAAPSAESISWFTLAMELVGGLALFLFGLEKMVDSLRTVAGSRLKSILAKLTVNRFAGVATGTISTALVQSSSVTTVLVVGFVSAGVITFQQSLGVILGAEIGTTFTAQILAFKITTYAPLLVAAGYLTTCFGRQKATQWYQHYGAGLMGLGLIFLGMACMGDAMRPLRSYPPFLELMSGLETPILGILVGTVFTALIQSSSATTGIIIMMSSQGLLTLPAGISLIIGANIGTCITALIASVDKGRPALRTAVAHVTFNFIGTAIWFFFIPQMADLVVWLSPSVTGLEGIEKLAAETPRQLANAHTVFNVGNTLMFLPILGWFEKGIYWLVPEKRY